MQRGASVVPVRKLSKRFTGKAVAPSAFAKLQCCGSEQHANPLIGGRTILLSTALFFCSATNHEAAIFCCVDRSVLLRLQRIPQATTRK